MAAVAAADLQITRSQLRGFRDARSGVVQKQEKGVLRSSTQRLAIRRREHCIHFLPGQPGDRLRHGLLGADGADLPAPSELRRIAAGDEAGEPADCSQPHVAGLRGAAAILLKVGEELQHAARREVAHGQAVGGLPGLAAEERHQQREGVPVALLCVASQVALGDDVLQ